MLRPTALAIVSCLGILCASGRCFAGEPVSIWFRSAEGCPNGNGFVERLRAHDVAGHIANAGDRIDFVVTLGMGEQAASGTLERQSARGTVALRELHAPSCDAVAEALALTLVLALDPDRPSPPAAVPHADPPPAAPAAMIPPPPAPARPHTDAPRQVATPTPRASVFSPSLGGQATAMSVVSSPLLGGNALFDLSYERGWRPSLRLSLGGGVNNDVADNVALRLLYARLAGCPFAVGLGRAVRAALCFALDLGSVHAASSAAGGASVDAFWSAAWATSRITWTPTEHFGMEVEGGLALPLTRYDLVAEQPHRTLAAAQTVGFGFAAGARWLP